MLEMMKNEVLYFVKALFTKKGLVTHCALFMSCIEDRDPKTKLLKYNEALYNAYVDLLNEMPRVEIFKFFAWHMQQSDRYLEDNNQTYEYFAKSTVKVRHACYLISLMK